MASSLCVPSKGPGHWEDGAGRRKCPRLQPFTSPFLSWLSIPPPAPQLCLSAPQSSWGGGFLGWTAFQVSFFSYFPPPQIYHETDFGQKVSCMPPATLGAHSAHLGGVLLPHVFPNILKPCAHLWRLPQPWPGSISTGLSFLPSEDLGVSLWL